MISETTEQHRKTRVNNISCGIITLSDSLYEKGSKGIEEDLSGQYIYEKLTEEYTVEDYVLIPDEKDKLVKALSAMANNDIDLIITTGGTGLESRDITIETLMERFDKTIPGFGEEFRRRTAETLKGGALLTRTCAGVYNKTLIFAMPGSPNAVELGMDIIYSEIKHLVKHTRI